MARMRMTPVCKPSTVRIRVQLRTLLAEINGSFTAATRRCRLFLASFPQNIRTRRASGKTGNVRRGKDERSAANGKTANDE